MKWVQNKKNWEIDATVTNLTGGGASKEVTLTNSGNIDPPTAPTFHYPTGVTLFKIRCKANSTSGTQIGPGGIITTVPSTIKTRPLTGPEKAVAKSVFNTSINLKSVTVTNTVGFQSGNWTTKLPTGGYLINVKVSFYDNLVANKSRQGLLIHELTHVWQGQHGVPFTSNSALHQTLSAIRSGSTMGAYDYQAGKQWGKYNVEQQASIVQHWFLRGKKSNDVLFPYIRDNVRPGKPKSATKFPSSLPAKPFSKKKSKR